MYFLLLVSLKRLKFRLSLSFSLFFFSDSVKWKEPFGEFDFFPPFTSLTSSSISIQVFYTKTTVSSLCYLIYFSMHLFNFHLINLMQYCNYFQDMTNLNIKYKERFDIQVTTNNESTVRWLKEELQKHTKVPVIQQELSYKDGDKKITLSDNEQKLKNYNIPDTGLNLKNLGKQIKWELVFYVEYLGPILIMPLFYALGKQQFYTDIQCVALVMVLIHYLKRQYETAFVHVFSRESMPFKRIIINSLHYWVYFALSNSIELYFFPTGHTYSRTTIGIIFAFWAIFEFMNYKCHKLMGDFRRAPKKKSDNHENPTKRRLIPYGYGYDLVSCANYFWETLIWVTYSIMTRNYTAYIFTIFSVKQMAEWALQKHRRYLKQFPDYPKNRKAIFPFIL